MQSIDASLFVNIMKCLNQNSSFWWTAINLIFDKYWFIEIFGMKYQKKKFKYKA